MKRKNIWSVHKFTLDIHWNRKLYKWNSSSIRARVRKRRGSDKYFR